MRIRFIATPTSLMLPRGESWSEGDVADLPLDQAQRWIGLDVAVEAPPESAPEFMDPLDALAEANPAVLAEGEAVIAGGPVNGKARAKAK